MGESLLGALFTYLLGDLLTVLQRLTVYVCVFRYVRAEVLAGFVNGLFLIFTAFFIFSEGVEVMRALTHTHIHTV